MTVREIYNQIMTTLPRYKSQNTDLWLTQLDTTLATAPCFGKIVRSGKTADGTPKENLHYYICDQDPVEWRRQAYGQVSRSARKCTLADKQYFWKMPPKLPNHRYRSSYVPSVGAAPTSPLGPLTPKSSAAGSGSASASGWHPTNPSSSPGVVPSSSLSAKPCKPSTNPSPFHRTVPRASSPPPRSSPTPKPCKPSHKRKFRDSDRKRSGKKRKVVPARPAPIEDEDEEAGRSSDSSVVGDDDVGAWFDGLFPQDEKV
ncbi:hypothetical protein BC936DRAFT_139666 [Jimgerdemannia flammicorona]|uniref:Uncharacterized protein n=2 Tax=Jimgerdemannia flammicorona TaxID=994334 RepID=A0A433P9B1_9FUNG|nr:hypothetical protein BC936DRAFT_139666 [Jimgerdemannia flammicorona]RUS14123.1 hypothetical protein BC938DRAFT_477524 [Jimgerdemannia flammicorona]